MTTAITEDMRGLIGRRIETIVSFPIDASDIRRWALAVYYPEKPPPRYWDAGSQDAAGWGGLVAPDDFNPFAWMAAERRGPGPEVRPIAVAHALIMAGATEQLFGVQPPDLTHGLNGGIAVTYGPARMRPGDVITDNAAISEYTEREGRLGLMLFTTTDHVWTNQRGDLVKTQRLTYIRY
jgi:hypothetical protein